MAILRGNNMSEKEKQLVKTAETDNKEELTQEELDAMELTFGRGRNKRTILCSKGFSLKNIVELSK